MGIRVQRLNIQVNSPDFGHWHFEITPLSSGESATSDPNVSALLAALSSLSAPRESVRTVTPRSPRLVADESWQAMTDRIAALADRGRADREARAAARITAPSLADLTDEPGERVQTGDAPDSLTDHLTDQDDQPTRRTRKVSTGGNKNHRWTLEDDETLRSMVDDGMRIAKMAAALKREKQAVKHRLYLFSKKGWIADEVRLALR